MQAGCCIPLQVSHPSLFPPRALPASWLSGDLSRFSLPMQSPHRSPLGGYQVVLGVSFFPAKEFDTYGNPSWVIGWRGGTLPFLATLRDLAFALAMGNSLRQDQE